MKTELILSIKKPKLPVNWDYQVSINKVKSRIYKWSKLTKEIACELWIAREILSQKPESRLRNTTGAFAPVDKTWESYCQEIGSTKSTVNRWLSYWENGSLVGKMTGNAENYTPVNIVNAVRDVLGDIDLDPASCEYAQKIIKAKKYYTKETNGLDKKWIGRVFLNPPYGMPDIRNFTDKLISELPNIKKAILLTNDQTDTNWWKNCARNADLICFNEGRLRFYTPTKSETSPTNGQSFMYFGNGNGESQFAERFGQIGLIAKILK